MATKIKLICFLPLLFVLCIQCKNSRHIASQKEQYRSIYIKQFKLTYLRKILIKSYNNSAAVHEIVKNDHSGFTEFILTEQDYQLIDSLTTIDNQKLKTDSLNRIGRVAEGAEGKHILGFILDKIESKWLDSLARKRLKLSDVPKSWIR